jgi:FtsZ-binding cell division protein ZapB
MKTVMFEIIGYVLMFAMAAAVAAVIISSTSYIRNKEADKTALLQARISDLQEDNRLLVLEKISLTEKNDELYDDNTRLSAAYRELEAKYSALLADLAEEAAMPLPDGHTNVISGMPYTAIRNKGSEQWKLQLEAYTDADGIRCYTDGTRDYILAAMGSAYTHTIGDAFHVVLRCGSEFDVMCGEFKDDGTDPNFFGHPTKHADGYDVTCVLEFIYDKDSINSKALQAGNFCNIEYFGGLHGDGGDIVKIEYLGRKWKP